MAKRSRVIKTYLTAEEYKEVQAGSHRAGLSLSSYLKMASLGLPIKSLEHQRERMELRRFRGELASLGGLLKQAIAAGLPKEQVNPLLRSMDRGLAELQELIRRT